MKKDLEQILIDSVYSNKRAKEYLRQCIKEEQMLYKILQIVEESESGDARMEGAYWISQCEKKKWLVSVEDRLLLLMKCEWDSITVHIMMALSKIRSQKALDIIIEERIRPELYWEAMALKNYFKNDEIQL